MTVVAAAAAVSLAGCGGAKNEGVAGTYPMVDTSPRAMQQPVTTPNGAVVSQPVLPTVTETPPSRSCERDIATFHDGSQPIIIPPAPGLRAVALTKHTTRVSWSFDRLSADCNPVSILIAVANWSDPLATPTVERVRVTGARGTVTITYPDFLPAPNAASASAVSSDGYRSRTVSVLIKRSARVPDDPPKPPPPVTAPAGAPVGCRTATTVVTDEAGDVLTYQMGSPPAPTHRAGLSGLDIVKAAVQIDGRRVCATFTFAAAPVGIDFELRFNVHDTEHSSCCTTLLFRRRAGRLELGSFAIDAGGKYQLLPVADAGALLTGNVLRISGTVPPPGRWQGVSTRRMPIPHQFAWSVTTGYFPNANDANSPSFGDWLPRYRAVGGAVIRQWDGAAVARPATR